MENNNEPSDAIETSRNETQRPVVDRTLDISVPRLNVNESHEIVLPSRDPIRDTMYSEDSPKYCKHVVFTKPTSLTCQFAGWVCFATDQDDKEGSGDGLQFITPCKCKGTLKNVGSKVRSLSYHVLKVFVVLGAPKLSPTMGR